MYCEKNRKSVSDGNKSIADGNKSVADGTKSIADGNKSPSVGQKRRSDDFLNEKAISDVDICNSSSHQKRKSVNVCLSADSPNSSSEVDYDEDEEVELEVEERSDPSEGSILEEDRILAEKHGFKAEWLESIATRCSPEAATSVISLCHILTERQNKIDRLAKSLTIWGITEPSWLRQDDIIIDNPERRGTPAIYRPGRGPEVRPVVTGSAAKLEILPARFSKSQVGAIIQHLRSCAIGKVGDRRLDLISPGACLTIGNAFVAEGIIDEIQSETDEWLQWCGLDLAEKLSRCFETDNPLSSATVDWKVMMLRNCNLQLNIRDRETYLSFVQSINQVVEDAVSKSTPEKDVVEALICSIFQGDEGDKHLTGPALAAKTLQSRLRSLSKQTPILNLRELCNRVLGICAQAHKTLEEADQWEERRPVRTPVGVQHQAKHKNLSPAPVSRVNRCDGCGAEAFKACQQCLRCVGHPDRNTAGRWQDSESYRAIRLRIPHQAYPILHNRKRLDGTDLTELELKSMRKLSLAMRKNFKSAKPDSRNKSAH